VAKQVISLLVDKFLNATADIVSADDAEPIIEMFEGAIEADDDVPWP